MAKPKSAVDAFITRCRAAAKDRNITLSTLSLYLLGDGKAVPRLTEPGADGEPRDIGARRLELATRELERFEAGKPTSYQVQAGLSGKGPPVRRASTSA